MSSTNFHYLFYVKLLLTRVILQQGHGVKTNSGVTNHPGKKDASEEVEQPEPTFDDMVFGGGGNNMPPPKGLPPPVKKKKEKKSGLTAEQSAAEVAEIRLLKERAKEEMKKKESQEEEKKKEKKPAKKEEEFEFYYPTYKAPDGDYYHQHILAGPAHRWIRLHSTTAEAIMSLASDQLCRRTSWQRKITQPKAISCKHFR